MTNLPINTFTGQINNQTTLLINARDLHELLQVKSHFKDWIKRRLSDSPFKENVDFLNTLKFERVRTGVFGTREVEVADYHLTIDTAKHFCLMENSEIGYKIRQQFIDNDNKARAELPRLIAENAALKQQLGRIPPFLLSNPDHTTAIIARAQQAFFTLHPECRELLRYRQMGLTNAEIGKLIGLSRDAVRKRLTKLFNLGLANPKNGNQHSQLVLNLA